VHHNAPQSTSSTTEMFPVVTYTVRPVASTPAHHSTLSDLMQRSPHLLTYYQSPTTGHWIILRCPEYYRCPILLF